MKSVVLAFVREALAWSAGAAVNERKTLEFRLMEPAKRNELDKTEAELRDARLNLIEATRLVIANGLGLLGVAAPQSM